MTDTTLADIEAMTHEDIASLMQDAADNFGVEVHELTGGQFRKHLNASGLSALKPETLAKMGGFRNIRDSFFPPPADVAAVQREEIKERAKIHRSQSLAVARDQLFLRQLEEVAGRAFAGKVYPSPFSLKRHRNKTERYLNVINSDLHFRALLDGRESKYQYGPHEEARRLAYVAKTVANYKLDHRDETTLNLYWLGDIIENQLHDMRTGAPLAEQTCAAIYLLTQYVSFLAQHFKRINVYCVTGNHGRNKARHVGRATNQKWDSVETVIYYSVKMACAGLKNVKFHIPRTPYVTVEMFGMKGYFTHGDTHINVGNPGKTVNVRGVEELSNRLNASLPDTDEYRVIGAGHAHAATLSFMNNGTALLVNGSLVPAGDYAESIGIPETAKNYQLMWETVPGHMVGDFRIISFGEDVDADEELESIIRPFHDF